MTNINKSAFNPEFPYDDANIDIWHEAALKALKGKEWDTLEKHSSDNLAIHPLYYVRPETFALAPKPQDFIGSWDIRQVVKVTDEKIANKVALRDLQNGVNSIEFEFTKNDADLATLLEGIHYDFATIAISPAASDLKLAKSLFGAIPDGKQKSALLALNLPVNAETIAFYKANKDTFTNSSFFAISALDLAETGASRETQVAFAISSGLELLKLAEAADLAIEEIAAKTNFAIGVNQENVVEIAKTRAVRQLWEKVCAKSQLDAPMSVHAYTTKAMMTEEDPYSNVLRSSIAVFAASIGGANIITTFAHDYLTADDNPTSKENDFARRLARNTQIVLANESSLGRVNDPAAGSYAFETITNEIAQGAWTKVQEIEKAGGITTAIQNEYFNTAE